MSHTPALPPPPPDASIPRPRLIDAGLLWPLAALGLLLAFNGMFTSRFFAVGTREGRLFGTPVDVLHRAAPTALLALGMTLVIATGGIDLSVGATMAIAATVAAVHIRGPVDAGGLPTTAGGSVAVALVLAGAAGLACGAWNGLLAAVLDIQPFVATLILMEAGRGVAELLSAGQTVTLAPGTLCWLHYLPPGGGWLRHHLLYPVPLDVIWAIAAAVLVAILTRRTALGLFLEAVGNNPLASRYAGVGVTGVKFAAYALCGVTAAAAGLLEAADLDAARIGLGTTRELDAILAVSLGGTALVGGRFSLAGSIIGAVVISTLNQTVQLTHVRGRQIPNEWFQVAEAVVIVATFLLQSESLRSRVRRLFTRRPPA
jgi:ribose/xylose/arabinose/galactoside ABC-type transport system permease subunit